MLLLSLDSDTIHLPSGEKVTETKHPGVLGLLGLLHSPPMKTLVAFRSEDIATCIGTRERETEE